MLAIVNSAAMNVGVHVSFRIMVFSGYMPRSGIDGSYGSGSLPVCFCFLKKYLFIFWLHQVLVEAHDLCCCVQDLRCGMWDP